MKLRSNKENSVIVPDVQIGPPADRNPAVVYINSLAPGSRRAMLQALDKIAMIITSPEIDTANRTKRPMSLQLTEVMGFAWCQLRYQHTQSLRTRLAESYAPSTANKAMSALKGVLKECWRLGLMNSDDYRRAVDLKRVEGQRLKQGRMLQPQELQRLFSKIAQGTNRIRAARDAAMIAMLIGAGLRRSEVVGLDRGDFSVEVDEKTGEQVGELKVRKAKRNKQRIVYMSNGALLAVEHWITLRGDFLGSLFCRLRKGDKSASMSNPSRFSDQTVYAILRRYSQDQPARLPKDLHFYITPKWCGCIHCEGAGRA